MRNAFSKRGHWPLWLARLLDSGRYGLRLLRPANQYPLADRADSLSCQPLFIVSSGRAGTTLLRSMLVVGGQIAIPPESQVIPAVIRRYLSAQHLGWYDLCRLLVALFESNRNFPLWEISLHPVYDRLINLPLAERSLARIIDEIFHHYATQKFPGAMMWGDQSPINTLYLPWLAQVFPRARYLHLLRDGRDAIASMLATGRTTLKEATQRWTVSVSRALALQARLPANQFLEVRYENLVSAPEEILRQICSFSGINFQTQMLDFWKLSTTVEHKHYAFHKNLQKPLFTSSIGKWVERLSETEQSYVLSHASSVLQQVGYLREEET